MSEPTCSTDGCAGAVFCKGMCKPCYGADYYQRTRERQRDQRRKWYEKNADDVKAKLRDAYQADPDKYKARVATWKAANPEYQRQYGIRRYVAQRVELLAAAKVYYRNNRAKLIERARRWAQANPEKRREIRRRYKKTDRGRLMDLSHVHVRLARKRGAPGKATPEQLVARWNYFGGRCWLCFKPASQWDHVIPLAGGGTNWPSNLRPACGPCNQSKGAKRVHVAE